MASLPCENDCGFANSMAARRLCCTSGRHSDPAAGQIALPRMMGRCNDDADVGVAKEYPGPQVKAVAVVCLGWSDPWVSMVVEAEVEGNW